jgi:hypothetical protein
MSNFQMEPKTCHIPCAKENYFIAQKPKRLLATYVLVIPPSTQTTFHVKHQWVPMGYHKKNVKKAKLHALLEHYPRLVSFFFLRNFTKFQPEKYDFDHLYKGFSMKKKGPNLPDFNKNRMFVYLSRLAMWILFF